MTFPGVHSVKLSFVRYSYEFVYSMWSDEPGATRLIYATGAAALLVTPAANLVLSFVLLNLEIRSSSALVFAIAFLGSFLVLGQFLRRPNFQRSCDSSSFHVVFRDSGLVRLGAAAIFTVVAISLAYFSVSVPWLCLVLTSLGFLPCITFGIRSEVSEG